MDLLIGLEEYVTKRQQFQPEIPSDIVTEMIKCIRFVHFSMDQMSKYVFGNSLIPSEVIIGALAEKVRRLQKKKKKN